MSAALREALMELFKARQLDNEDAAWARTWAAVDKLEALVASEEADRRFGQPHYGHAIDPEDV